MASWGMAIQREILDQTCARFWAVSYPACPTGLGSTSYPARIAGMIDEAQIEVRAGDGGSGMVAFLREAMRPMGGPSGGNGGSGGSIVLVADDSINTLLKFRYRRHWIAKRGGNGEQNRRNGADGGGVQVSVPVGTEVWESVDEDGTERDVFLGDLVTDGQRMVVARGGRGGIGNAEFVSAVNQEPRLAEAGSDGQTKFIRLNLKLLADVGIIGMPNAGKSSLLTAMSAARPKVADYPFTTIEPVLGMVELGFDAFAAVDIPGLIEGAAQGTGLGHTFLKHIQRTRLLLHIVDGSESDIASNIRQINSELSQYDADLGQKPQVLVVNKSDTEEVSVLRDEIESEVRSVIGDGHPVYFISAATRQGVDDLIPTVFHYLRRSRRGTDDEESPRRSFEELLEQTRSTLYRDDLPVVQARGSRRPAVKLADGAFRILHQRAVRLANGSNLDNWDAQVQFHQRLVQMNVARGLNRLGIKRGDPVRAGDWEFAWP